MSFAHFGLCEPILQAVYGSGYSKPTEIQEHAIPLALKGIDILGCAPTGTGKTAAFVLPILDQLLRTPISYRHPGSPSALILTPTRELALQIEEAVNEYGMYTNINALSVYGGVSIVNQIKELNRGVDIVVATPGRLLDHLSRRTINLSRVEILVLDEADRMYDMGFIYDVRKIIDQVPKNRQTMLFSATMSDPIRKLVAGIQREPYLIEVGLQYTPVDTVTQTFYTVPQPMKVDLLLHIVEKANYSSVLVFSRTKHGADKIARHLERAGIRTAALHADRTQSQRKEALDGFKQGMFQVLVATDIASRGIDIDGISCVLNFDTPMDAEDYIHRIGRTGRADASGEAITFVSDDEKKFLKRIEYYTNMKCELKKHDGITYPAESVSPNTSGPARKSTYYRKPRFAAMR